MDYKIAWFTEGGLQGKVPRNHPNMRNDMSWMYVLNVDHYPIQAMHQVDDKFDLGIITFSFLTIAPILISCGKLDSFIVLIWSCTAPS